VTGSGFFGYHQAARTRVKTGDMINLDYPDLLDEFKPYLDPKRSESASFLIWYLEQYYRLDTLEAVDSVCDQKGDRGVDGIFVNDNDQTITIFQARISQRRDRTVGDASLREFAGTLTQFQSKESLQALANSAGNTDLAALIKNLDLINKIDTHDVTGEYLTNIDIDANGTAFLTGHPIITFCRQVRTSFNVYIRLARCSKTRGSRV
jgi:hypothetical protein